MKAIPLKLTIKIGEIHRNYFIGILQALMVGGINCVGILVSLMELNLGQEIDFLDFVKKGNRKIEIRVKGWRH